MRTRRAIEIGVEHLGDVEGEVRADEVGLLHRAEHGGARAEALAYHDVDGVGVADAGGDQRDRLALHRVLQTVADEARHVAAHMDRRLSGVAQ